MDENNIDAEILVLTGELYGLRISGSDDFYDEASWVTLTIHCEGAGTSTIDIDDELTFVYGGAYTVVMVDATVNQHPRPVGGAFTPVNKLAVAAPFLALIAVAAVATVYVAKRRRRA